MNKKYKKSKRMMQYFIIMMLSVWIMILLVSFNEPKEQCIIEDTPTEEIVSLKTQNEPTWDDFLSAVMDVESGGSVHAYNVKENAAGCLQIRPIMVREVNRVLRKNKVHKRYTLEDRWNREKSIEMFEIMAEQVDCCEDLEFMEFAEIVARKWNGGGRGHKKSATLGYWSKIEQRMLNEK